MTLYGRPARVRAHPALAGLVGAAVATAVGVAVFVFTHGSDSAATKPVAAPSASPGQASSGPASSGPVSSAPASLARGDRLMSPADQLGTFLTVDGEFAAFSTAESTVITVVPGLADPSCFSFQVLGAKYLRHFDYRLRADRDDKSPLFQQDATFCPEGTQLHSYNYPDHVLHRRGTDLYIDKPDNSATFTAESHFSWAPPQ